MVSLASAMVIAPKPRPRRWLLRSADARAATDGTTPIAVLRLIQKYRGRRYGRKHPLVQNCFAAAVQASRSADYQTTATRRRQLAASSFRYWPVSDPSGRF